MDNLHELFRNELTFQVIENIVQKSSINEKGCWLYNGSLSDGYSRIYCGFRLEGLHRIVAVVKLGYHYDSPMLVLHKCHNRNCFNYEHLYIGTHQDNTIDSINHGTFNRMGRKKTHCPYGHEYTEANTIKQGNKRKCRECDKARKRFAKRSSSTKGMMLPLAKE